ncbi:uncharacterized protein LY79DRAFT_587567 [Colletotrichum navitas]|uniref:Uncharacterized protein n=1 Tax=Colletotrichum navitas TaxID=681940 RepID=A0AAD8Q700_9PEZI|nr:uncharacterized protein LY79DRAFT_587567 [Colletotrichum navitas]KAK1597098.1 hypothetical protein LY79DRAFT_587567 [Colletotrichum navitas]
MCILLQRIYRCWKNDAWTQHPYSYLNRCANPRYADCIAPGALGMVTENYDVPCPSCTNEFFQTRHAPVRVTANLHTIDESSPRAQAAAQEYAKSLVEFLTMAFTPAGTVVDDADDQRAFRVCKMETACRFDKDHFDNGAFCTGAHWTDPKQKELFEDIPTNTWPELHNLGAAMRRTVSQGYLFPYRGYWPCQMAVYDPVLVAQDNVQVVPVTDMNTERPRNEGVPDVRQPSYEYCVQRHLGQPDIQVLKNVVDPANSQNTPVAVIPFLKSKFDEGLRLEKIWQETFCGALVKFGGSDAWEDLWRQYSLAPADGERMMRCEFSLIATKLLCQDSGLSHARARAVADILVHIWEINPVRRGELVGPALLGPFEKLLEAGRDMMRFWPYSFTGEMLFNEETLQYTQYHFKRNLALWLQDEHVRQRAIDDTFEPLTAGEVDALAAADGDPDAIDCVACGEEMARPPHAHAAVRLKCGAGHMIGKNCWTRSLRRKTGVQMDGIRCHSCADKVLGPWKMPVNLGVVDAYRVTRTDPSDLHVPDDIQL